MNSASHTGPVVTWGLLSTARINRSLIPILQASPRTRLLAVASRDRDRAEAYARTWNIPRAYGRYEELLADPEVQVIYNSLPNHLHAEWTIRALEAGKHVLCEKPLAISLEEVDAMIATARRTGRVLAEAFMYRHHPQTLRVVDLVQSGALGRVYLVRGAFTFRLERPGNYRHFEAMGGGSLWDVGCYPVSYARLILGGEPIEVFGRQVRGPGGGDVIFVGQMRFSGDRFAQFDSGFASPFRTFIEIVGSEGTLFVPQPFKPGKQSQVVLRRGGQEESISIVGQELYWGEVEDLCDAVVLGRPPRVSLEESRGNVATLRALLESAQSGQVVRV